MNFSHVTNFQWTLLDRSNSTVWYVGYSAQPKQIYIIEKHNLVEYLRSCRFVYVFYFLCLYVMLGVGEYCLYHLDQRTVKIRSL
jgi:hypothetical protein